MWKLSLFILFLQQSTLQQLVECSNDKNRGHQQRIIGGRPAIPGEFPYQLSVNFLGEPLCGATLVRSPLGTQIAISAAHCFQNTKLRKYNPDSNPAPILSVMAGSVMGNDTNYPAQILSVVEIIAHPTGNADAKQLHDIAVIFLDGNFELNEYVKPIALPAQGQEYFGDLTVSGWGTTVEGQPEYPNELRVVRVPVVSNERCAELYTQIYDGTVFENEICAGFEEGGKDSCSGDSGGPAVGTMLSGTSGQRQEVLVGVTSWGYGCALPGFPGVYSRVSYYRNWIDKVSFLYELFGIVSE